jgi:hypothetical protein
MKRRSTFAPPKPQPKPVLRARRCPSGEYEVCLDGVVVASGFDDFEEAEAWIEERNK